MPRGVCVLRNEPSAAAAAAISTGHCLSDLATAGFATWAPLSELVI